MSKVKWMENQAYDGAFEIWFCSLSMIQQILFRNFGVTKFSDLICRKKKFEQVLNKKISVAEPLPF